MAEELPIAPSGEFAGVPPTSSQWATANPALAQRSHAWAAVLLAGVAMVVALAGLVVSLTRPTAPRPTTITARTYRADETFAAQRKLCDTYSLAARAVQVDTNGHDIALGRIALTNAAAMLDDAGANPAVGATYRDSAHALAESYRTGTAMGNRDIATDAQFHAALDDINAKDAAMKKLCGRR